MVFDTCPMEGMDSARVKRLLGLPASGGGDHGDFLRASGPREGFMVRSNGLIASTLSTAIDGGVVCCLWGQRRCVWPVY